ncbi:uncharacterized protein Eint_091140 [Encephalitozoon intestinalis ATCC 50506]|uniref:Autophagy-related protein 9 n=1 Tax=Encephalitozoon intestinalis (strain ATCC 50506) TaxID=876142 RepID=E0S8X7_ENCIT|nr:uncharacterized protein Eint_091140 [Encephalitozoon intestinalis ATCC 50506]ADM12243.1 hypothetical protein Eint_091140 [Encephalitozoon intestinalis ATCC 50506]
MFVTASLCLTVYLASNIDSIRSNKIPRLGVNFSSAALVIGGVFVGREAISYAINFRKMVSIFYMYRYILERDMEEIRFKDVVSGMIKLEREVHNRDLEEKDVRDIVNHNRLLLLLMMRKFPSIFRPACSRFLLHILHGYIHRIEEGPVEELGDEIRVVSIGIFILSPAISIFFILYYIAKIIEKSQSNMFYVFKKSHRPWFKYMMAKRNEYPHETHRKIQKGAGYLNGFFLSRKRDCIPRVCSGISFLLSCLVFLVGYLILSILVASKPNLSQSLSQDITVFGRTTNIVYLSYLMGGISCCLRCLSIEYGVSNRRKMFAKWCVLMEQTEVLKYCGRRGSLEAIMSKIFVPRIYLFLVEIVSPFIVPFQLEGMRRRLERIRQEFESVGEGEYDRRVSILDL